MGLKGFRSFKRKVRNMERKLDNVDEKIMPHAEGVAEDARSRVLTGGQIWTGNLASSFVVRKTGNQITIENTARYANYVEYGTGRKGRMTDPMPGDFSFRVQYAAPGLTPEGEPPDALIANIQAWVHAKPNFIGPFGPMTREEVGYAIAHNIAREGTNAHPFMRPAWFNTKPSVVHGAEQAVRNAVRRS